MRIPRIYHEADLAVGAELTLDNQASAHLTRVLRLGEGAPLVVFNGRGGEYAARLVNATRRGATIRLEAYRERDAESPLDIVLAQGVSRGERMDYTIQKAVELGVGRIVPVVTERTAVNLNAERAAKRQRHWRGVVQAACEQSGRNQVPEVEAPQDLERWLAACHVPVRVMMHHAATETIDRLPTPVGTVALLIGPEGGLSEAERTAAERAGFVALRFGPRVLRTETAALAALAVMQAQWGDLTT